MRRPNRNNTAFSEVGEKTDFISARKLGEINFLIIILTKKNKYWEVAVQIYLRVLA